MSQHHALLNLPVELWQEISGFLPIRDLIPCQLFLLSKTFHSFFLSESQQHLDSVIDQSCYGGLYYKILCECLMRERIVNTIDRIMNRKLFIYKLGDFDESRNAHDYELFINEEVSTVPMPFPICEGESIRKVHAKSRLNVEPNGRSMAKLRKQLKVLIGFSLDKFPQLIDGKRNEIDRALKKSINGCVHIDKLSNGKLISECIKNDTMRVDRKPNKPKIWDMEKRQHSIQLLSKKAHPKKDRNIQWKTLWKHQYHEFLLDELKYYRDNLKSRMMVLKHPFKILKDTSTITIDGILDSMEQILDILPRLGTRFFKEFRKQNFFTKQIKAMAVECIYISFVESFIITLSQFVKYKQKRMNIDHIGKENYERVVSILDRCMSIYEEDNTTLKDIFPDISIYNYIIKLRNDELIERYFTPTASERIKEAKRYHDGLLMYCLSEIEEPSDFLLDFIRTLSLNIVYTRGDGDVYEYSICIELLSGFGVYTETFNSRKWFSFLIDYFGKQQLIAQFEVDLNDYSFSRVLECHKRVIIELFGIEFEEILKAAEEKSKSRMGREYMGGSRMGKLNKLQSMTTQISIYLQ